MAVVKFTALSWECDKPQTYIDHIQQFHEKFKELGIIHIPKPTDIDFSVNNTSKVYLTGVVGNNNTRYDICSFVYKLPKGDGTINYSEPDIYNVQLIDSFSPKPYDVYIKITWQTYKSSYSSVVARGYDFCNSIEISREDNFNNNINRPTFNGSQIYYSSYVSNASYYSGIKSLIEGDTIMSLTPDGLVVLHGLHTLNEGRSSGTGGPRFLTNFILNIQNDGVIGVYDNSVNVDFGTTNYGSTTLSTTYKCCYNYKYCALNNNYLSYDRPIGVTPYPFTDVPNNALGELQGLPCYSMDKKQNVVETYQLYTFQRGITTGEHDYVVYREGKVLKRQLLIQELNSMTPQTSGTWSTTFTDYNREYGYIIEYAPLINLE